MRTLVLALLLLSLPALAKPPAKPAHKPPPPVRWVDDWDTGWQLSRRTHRPILLMFCTSWSRWCKAMDEQVWSRPHLRMLAARYVMIRLDAEKDVLMANRFKVLGYPTILLSYEGYALGREVGQVPAHDMVLLMQKGLRVQAVLQEKLR